MRMIASRLCLQDLSCFYDDDRRIMLMVVMFVMTAAMVKKRSVRRCWVAIMVSITV